MGDDRGTRIFCLQRAGDGTLTLVIEQTYSVTNDITNFLT